MDRLEELKLQNMKSVIQAIRAELADYWDKCFYSQEQREGFSPYYDGGCWLFPLIDAPAGAAGCLLAGQLPRRAALSSQRRGDPGCLLTVPLYPLQMTIQRPCSSSTMPRWGR